MAETAANIRNEILELAAERFESQARLYRELRHSRIKKGGSFSKELASQYGTTADTLISVAADLRKLKTPPEPGLVVCPHGVRDPHACYVCTPREFATIVSATVHNTHG